MPEVFGKYQLIERIAKGGMAEVFLARQSGDVGGFTRLVAIKRMFPHMVDRDDVITMFIDEARIVSTLNHPAIVPIYDLGVDDGAFYLVMEYVDGLDLRRVCEIGIAQNDFLPRELAVHIVSEAAAGLHYAHTRVGPSGQPMNIVHRDISPQNILVGRQGEVKICDFGIARAESRLTNTRTGEFKGKFSYMSPEQFQADTIDARSDIFTLGIVLYEITVGARLFRSNNEYETMKKVCEARVTPPTQIRPDYPPDLEAIVLRALQRDPRMRYQSAEELRGALEDWLYEHRHRVGTAQVARYMEGILRAGRAGAQAVSSSALTPAPISASTPSPISAPAVHRTLLPAAPAGAATPHEVARELARIEATASGGGDDTRPLSIPESAIREADAGYGGRDAASTSGEFRIQHWEAARAALEAGEPPTDPMRATPAVASAQAPPPQAAAPEPSAAVYGDEPTKLRVQAISDEVQRLDGAPPVQEPGPAAAPVPQAVPVNPAPPVHELPVHAPPVHEPSVHKQEPAAAPPPEHVLRFDEGDGVGDTRQMLSLLERTQRRSRRGVVAMTLAGLGLVVVVVAAIMTRPGPEADTGIAPAVAVDEAVLAGPLVGHARVAVELETVPPGARVAVNGHMSAQATPGSFEVYEGVTNEIVFYHPDRRTHRMFVTGREGVEVAPVELPAIGEASRVRMNVRSTPAGATVWLDGVEVGTTPVRVENVLAGVEHHVEMRREGHHPFVGLVHAVPGMENEVDGLLSERGLVSREVFVEFAYEALPRGTRVEVDGEFRGVTPFIANHPRDHLLEVSLQSHDHESVRRIIAAREAGNLLLRPYLEPVRRETGRVSLQVRQPASIYIGSRAYGMGPIRELELAEGEHPVVFEQGRNRVRTTIEVRPNAHRRFVVDLSRGEAQFIEAN